MDNKEYGHLEDYVEIVNTLSEARIFFEIKKRNKKAIQEGYHITVYGKNKRDGICELWVRGGLFQLFTRKRVNEKTEENAGVYKFHTNYDSRNELTRAAIDYIKLVIGE